MSDTITALAEALYSYLAEIEEYRTTCERHQKTAVLFKRDEAISIVRRCKATDTNMTFLRSSLAKMPGWEQTLYHATEGRRWEAIRGRFPSPPPGENLVAGRRVGWKGRAYFVQATASRDTTLTVAIAILPVRRPVLSGLPLREVALVLACHETLLPDSMATFFPADAKPEEGCQSLWGYLRGAMPENLYASRCIPREGAGHSTPPISPGSSSPS